MPIEASALSAVFACLPPLPVCYRFLARPQLLIRFSALPREGVPRLAVLTRI